MSYPKIGDTVNIQHTVNTDPRSGISRIVGAPRFTDSTITTIYGSGRVRVKSGDTWRVGKFNGKVGKFNGKWTTTAEA